LSHDFVDLNLEVGFLRLLNGEGLLLSELDLLLEFGDGVQRET